MSDPVDDFLEHHGVKGMQWGVRRSEKRDARSERIKKGTATRRDRLIREADLDGGRTQEIRRGERNAPGRLERLGYVVLGAVLALHGARTLREIRNDR